MGGFSLFKPNVDELRNYTGSLSSRLFGKRRIPTWEAQGYADRYGRPIDPNSRELVIDRHPERRADTPLFGIGAGAGTHDSYVTGGLVQIMMGREGPWNDGMFMDPSVAPNYGRLLGVAQRNEVIYRCMRLLQDAAAAPKLEVQFFTERPVPKIRPIKLLADREFAQEKSSDWDPDKSHGMKKLLMRPNRRMTGKVLLSLWVADLNTFGKFYALKVRSSSGKVVELWRLDPRNVEADVIIDNEVRRWKYTEYGEDGQHIRESFYRGEDVIFDTFINQANPYLEGLPPMAVAMNAGLADIGKTDFIRQFFDNKATPGGVLTVENVVLDQEKADDIKRRWYERFSRWSRGQNSIAVLDQNAKYQAVSSKLDELDSEFTTSQLECRLCMVFGVPPVLAFTYGGINRATYTNSDQSEAFFWSNTLIPMFDALLDCLTWQLLPDFEPEDDILEELVRLRWNYEDVKALQEDITKVHERARQNVKDGIWRVSEARKVTGVPVDPYADYYLRQAKVVPSYPDVAASDAAILGQVPSVQVIATPGKDQGQRQPGDGVDQGAGAQLDEIAQTVQNANPQADAVRNAVANAKETRPQ